MPEIRDEQAETKAYKHLRELTRKDPCALCEAVDCEGCDKRR